jgi:hypothetical protein
VLIDQLDDLLNKNVELLSEFRDVIKVGINEAVLATDKLRYLVIDLNVNLDD